MRDLRPQVVLAFRTQHGELGWAREWKRLLTDAGVRSARLHDARHTAATVLLLLGVPERSAMEVMGWPHEAMAKQYQHMTAVLRQDIANRLDGVLWGPTETGTETDPGT